MRCGQRHGAPVRSARPPPAECEYDEVWTCERGLSVLPVTTGHPPHVFQMRINQQEGVLGIADGVTPPSVIVSFSKRLPERTLMAASRRPHVLLTDCVRGTVPC